MVEQLTQRDPSHLSFSPFGPQGRLFLAV